MKRFLVLAAVAALLGSTATPVQAQGLLKRLTGALPMTSPEAPPQAAPEKPKLIVAIAVDQYSANLFDEWRGQYRHGLKRLAGGIVYTSGYQSHAGTETCPGHSTLLTGKRPNKTGIVGNNLRDPATDKDVYCLLDPTVTLAHDPKAMPVGPARLMASTLGEWLKAASPGSRVVSVSGKDRGSIPMAGHNPDGVFWLFPGYGFTTYLKPGQNAEEAMAPLAALNAGQAHLWTNKPVWKYQTRACRKLESDWIVGEKPWRSAVPPTAYADADTPKEISDAVMASPTPDDLTLEAARALIKHYDLGGGPATNLLAVSFSSSDFVGHRYGTRGPEMCEQQHRLDKTIGTLLSDLDRLKVPYLVVLTADHGGSDFTERLAAHGAPEAVRVNGDRIVARVNDTLMKQYGLARAPLTGNVEEMFFDPSVPTAIRSQVARSAVTLLESEPAIAGAFTEEDLLATTIPKGTKADEFTLKQRFSASTYRGRSGVVVTALQPAATRYGVTPGSYIAGHGTPWNYDRRVPILFWWKGAPRQDRFLPVETVDIAPTLAGVLGLTPPADIDGRRLDLNR